MNSISISNKKIGINHPCFIVAEIGINHNGDVCLAKELIDAAVTAGADGVKFQNYKTSDFISNTALNHTYKQGGEETTMPQLEMFKKYELTDSQLIELKKHCDSKGVVFLSTPTGSDGLKLLQTLGVELIKNGSDFLTNVALIEEMAHTQIPTVISVGMATEEEIEDAVKTFKRGGGEEYILLHCTSSYPAPADEINLSRIPALLASWNCLVGFSDHSEGNDAAIGATLLGACFIEKHFTLDKKLEGPDHCFSANPEEFKALVLGIRNMETMLGSPTIKPTKSEVEGRKQFRMSCVAAVNLERGEAVGNSDVVFSRPGTGISPKHKQEMLGKVLAQAISKGDQFEWSCFHE